MVKKHLLGCQVAMGVEGLLQRLLEPLVVSWPPAVQLSPGLEVTGDSIPLLTGVLD